MKTFDYKGFKCEMSKVDEGGYEYSIFRIKDKWELGSGWNPSLKSYKETKEECKITVDDYYENPSNYED